MYRTDTKLYVLTGFLGSGKTTVLLKLFGDIERTSDWDYPE